jgi:biopolymer transport protein ExbB/TolQ
MGTTLGSIAAGGPTVLLILIIGLLGVLVLIERFYVVVIRSQNNGRAFIERIIQLVRADKIDEAIKQCTTSKAALPDIGILILRSRSHDEGDLQKVAAAASLMVLPKLTHRIGYLATFAIASLLLGVLGAMLGVRDAFLIAAATPGDVRYWSRLAQSTAPLCVGLIVAVVLVVGRGYLVAQADAIDGQVREFSARLINALIDRADVRLGHR